MDLTFLTNLRKINEDDERIVTITLLIDIISNLLNDRTNSRHHTLPNDYIQEFFSKYPSAIQCLHSIGFKQINNDYIFDQNISNEQLQQINQLLENELLFKNNILKDLEINDNDELFGKDFISFSNVNIPLSINNLIPFISTLKLVQLYEDKNLRQYILSSIIPLQDFHRRISKKMISNPLIKRDLLLLELLRWFKEEFFTWFDRATCDRCKTSMEFLRYTQPTRDERDNGSASRVELYRCSTCSWEYRFPRYNSPKKLLETRLGRCGEAANLFTCLCRALSYRARYIHDTTDHVWTEVYSENDHRWLHCDACENLCDSPLVYEKGWKKNLSFCIAFAWDHIEDVTWRYVTNFKQTIQTRNINEKQFVKIIHRINRNIQIHINQQQNNTIMALRIGDLVSILKEQNITKESELHGRQSGSLTWKLSRGETDQEDDVTHGFVYLINNEECQKGSIEIEYNSVKDQYYRNGIVENKKDGWIDRVYSTSNIQRKVERDWKMVYLSRKQLNSNGLISWTIQLKPEDEKIYRFDRIYIQCPSTIFDQYAKILCQLQIGDDLIIDLPQNKNSSFEYVFNEQKNSLSNSRINFRIILSSTNDDNDTNAWQKAQLFRHSIENISDDNRTYFLRMNLNILKK